MQRVCHKTTILHFGEFVAYTYEFVQPCSCTVCIGLGVAFHAYFYLKIFFTQTLNLVK